MLLLYKEIRNKIKSPINSSTKTNYNTYIKKNESFNYKNQKAQKQLFSNSKTINYEKPNSFFVSKKIEELKDISNFINHQNNKIKESKKRKLLKNSLNKYSYTFQNFYNNYPKPEPFPKKIDIRIFNHNDNENKKNNNNNDSSSINDRDIYDDKKILFILTNLNLENLYSKFKDNYITYNDLKFLTKDDFIEMNIPIGPRNRLIHFIKEFKKIKEPLDFKLLKYFIDEYNKEISGKNNNKNKNYFSSQNSNNSLFLYSKIEQNKKNISFFEDNKTEKINNYNNSDILNIKKTNKYFSQSKLPNSKSEKKINKIKKNENKKNINNNKNSSNNSISLDFCKTNFTCNEESMKCPSSIHDYKNNSKIIKNNEKKTHKLIRNNAFINKKFFGAKKILRKSHIINNYNLSKIFMNKLDIINKEVEKYEINYKKLKTVSKDRNKKIQKILSGDSFYKKSSDLLKSKVHNDNNNIPNFLILHENNNIDDEIEKNIEFEF